MANHKIEIGDETTTEDAAGTPQVERKSYTVTSEDGLFKNGKLYKTGDSIELDEATADRFKEAGEIK